jgi:HAMP domain-containing protein
MSIFLIGIFFVLLLTMPVAAGVIAFYAMSRLQRRQKRDERLARDLMYVRALNRRIAA